jgi:hypothetical protein
MVRGPSLSLSLSGYNKQELWVKINISTLVGSRSGVDLHLNFWTARSGFLLPRLQQDFAERFPESQRKRYRHRIADLALLLRMVKERQVNLVLIKYQAAALTYVLDNLG